MPFNKHKKASSPVEQKSIKSGASCHRHVMGHLDALRIGVLTKGTNAQAKRDRRTVKECLMQRAHNG